VGYTLYKELYIERVTLCPISTYLVMFCHLNATAVTTLSTRGCNHRHRTGLCMWLWTIHHFTFVGMWLILVCWNSKVDQS